MKTFRVFLISILGFTVVSALTGCGPPSAPTDSHFVYAVNNEGNSISVFEIDDQTGALEFKASAATEDEPRCAAVHPGGNHLFVATDKTNVDEDYIQIFEINQSTGLLKCVHSELLGLDYAPQRIAFTPDGFLIVTYPDIRRVEIYDVDLTTYDITFKSSIGMLVKPKAIAVHPTGDCFYIAVDGTNVLEDEGQVRPYDIGDTGMVSAGTAVAAGGIQPVAAVINPAGTCLYVANYTSGKLQVLSITDGALSSTLYSYDLSGIGCLAVSADNNFVFAGISNGLGIYSYFASGSTLALVDGSPFAPDDSAACCAAIDSTGQFLYVARGYSPGEISAYRITGTGTLEHIGDYPGGDYWLTVK